MAIYEATESARERLVGLPESGMGFQVLQYRQDFLVAFNATFLVSLAELREHPAVLTELARLLVVGEDQGDHTTERLELETVAIAFSELDTEYWVPGTGLNRPEISAAPQFRAISRKRPHSYYRFSVSPRDHRVAANGDYLPDTYATTYADLHFVPSGFAAVGRYALPNPASARFVHQLTTFDRPSRMGTVTPNFGQAGGGVEVLFASGASHDPSLSFMIPAG